MYKKILFHTPVLIGTTTQEIDFNFGQITYFIIQGIKNLIGINAGPSYLSVLDHAESPEWLKFTAISCASLALGLVILGIYYNVINSNSSKGASLPFWKITAFLISLIGALLASASVTFRQEYRWLYPAYIIFFIFLSFISKRRDNHFPKGISILLWIFIILTIPREAYIRSHRDNFYGRSAYLITNDLYETLEHVPEIQEYDRIIIGGDEVPDWEWTFMGDTFSKYYGIPAVEFNSGHSTTNASSIVKIAYSKSIGKFVLTNGDHSENDITALRHAEIINTSQNKISTPNNTVSFPLSMGKKHGWALAAPGVLEVTVPENSKFLVISFSHAWANGDGFTLDITSKSANQTGVQLLSSKILPLKKDDTPEWKSCILALPDNCSQIEVALQSISGDQVSDWVVIRNFSFKQR
jgi:hypothetical protein